VALPLDPVGDFVDQILPLSEVWDCEYKYADIVSKGKGKHGFV